MHKTNERRNKNQSSQWQNQADAIRTDFIRLIQAVDVIILMIFFLLNIFLILYLDW